MKKKGNNAQITSKILLELSTSKTANADKEKANKMVKGMSLLCHTGMDGNITAHEIGWLYDEGRQGIGFSKQQLFLSDVMVKIFDDAVIKNRVLELFKETDENFYTALQFISYIMLTNHQFFETDQSIKANSLDEIDIEDWVNSYYKWYESWKKDNHL